MNSEKAHKGQPIFSVIIPFYNEPFLTAQTVASVEDCSPEDTEIILVDNGSSHPACKTLPYVKVRFKENRGFAAACNAGIHASNGEFIVLLNNDTLVTPHWLTWLRDDLFEGQSKFGLRAGLIGPVSNMVAQQQQVKPLVKDLTKLNHAAIIWRAQNMGKLTVTPFLSGFCLMIARWVFDEVGYFDEQFFPGGFEDNDFLARCLEKGIHAILTQGVYIHHFGQQTFKRMKVHPLICRTRFMNKWQKRLGTKVVAMYRVHNDYENFAKSLENVSRLVDEIVVFDDRSTDPIEKLIKSFPKVVSYHKKPVGAPFEELTDRNRLLSMALERNPDWILSIDSDECFEVSFTRRRLERILRFPAPHMRAVLFHFYTLWDSTSNWRADGIFGHMSGPRLFRACPGQKLGGGTKEGLHCSHVPVDALSSVSLSPIRIIHFGYLHADSRQQKYEWYESLDSEKRRALIGGENYRHLIDYQVELKPFIDREIVLCTLSPGPSDQLFEMLERHFILFDDVWVLNTEPKSSMSDIERLYPDIKIFDYRWQDDYSAARNYLLERVDYNPDRWIFWIDPDEQLALPMDYVRYFETNVDMLLVGIYELMPDQEPIYHQLVRVHRHIPEIKFANRVHENFDRARARYPWLRIQNSPFTIYHHGYLKSHDEIARKFTYYKKLILQEIEEDPNAAQPHFDLALHLFEEGKSDEAAVELAKAIKLNPDLFEARKELGIWHLQEAKNLFRMLSDGEKVPTYIKETAQQLVSALNQITPDRRSILNALRVVEEIN